MTVDRHSISLSDAIALTDRWRKNQPNSMRAARFDRIAFDRLLAQPGVAGIRIYLGMHPSGEWTYVMVGTSADGEDLIKAPGSEDAGGGTGVEEQAWPCPPDCDCASPLNGDCPPPE